MLLALAADNLALQFALKKFGNKSLFFVAKWHTPQVPERSLREVVEERKQKFLGVALPSNFEHALADALNHQNYT